MVVYCASVEVILTSVVVYCASVEVILHFCGGYLIQWCIILCTVMVCHSNMVVLL